MKVIEQASAIQTELLEEVREQENAGHDGWERGTLIRHHLHSPSSSDSPQRWQRTRRSSRQRPIPSGNHTIAASTPVKPHTHSHIQLEFQRNFTGGRTELTKESVPRFGNMLPGLETRHLRVVRRQKRGDWLAGARILVMIHRWLLGRDGAVHDMRRTRDHQWRHLASGLSAVGSYILRYYGPDSQYGR